MQNNGFQYTDPDNLERSTRIDVVVTDEEGNIIMQDKFDKIDNK